MSFFDRFRSARQFVLPSFRASSGSEGGEFFGLNDPRLLDFIRDGFGSLTQAGVTVTPKQAMRNTTVMRCVSLISFSIGMLPLHLHERSDKSKAVDHPLFKVLHRRPNAWQTAYEFRSYMQQAALGALDGGERGDAFALIVRSGPRITQLVPMHPSRVTVHQRADWALEYHYRRPDNSVRVLQQDQVFHVRYGLSEDGLTGLSLVKQAAEAIGLAIQTEKAAARLFRNGMLVGGVLKTANQLSPEAYERLQASMENRRSAENAHKDLILEDGLDYDVPSQSGRDSQHLEQRQHQIEEIARPFGVPRPLVGMDDTSWGSGIDVLGQLFVRYSLNPWFTAWEQAVERSLLTDAEAERFEAKFNAGALLRGSIKDQGEFFAKALGSGGHQPWAHPSEIRELLDWGPRNDLPPAPGQTKGDRNEPSQAA